MKICLIGGIYGAPQAYRDIVLHSPEITLERGLRSQRHEVTTISHYDPLPREHFDIVHAHHLSWGTFRAVCEHHNARVIFTMHGMHAGADVAAYRRLSARYVLARADAVVALSQYEAEQLSTRCNVSARKQAVIPNGIDFAVYTPAFRDHTPRERWRLLYVGQLIELKRVDVLLRALSVCAANIELELVFHVDTLRRELEALAASLGIASRIRFLGPRTPHKLARLYQQADVFVLPSTSEALPSVVTEAMSCGTPVIATRVGGIPEQLDGSGLMVPPGDAEKFAQAITHMLSNYRYFARRAEAMAVKVRERYSVEQMVEHHLRLYETVLRRPATKRHNLSHVSDAVLLSIMEYACRRAQQHRAVRCGDPTS